MRAAAAWEQQIVTQTHTGEPLIASCTDQLASITTEIDWKNEEKVAARFDLAMQQSLTDAMDRSQRH